jgi:uncharacterized protein involved in exopolysaccharide biosynthesis
MYFSDFWHALIRRWYAVTLGVLGTVGLCLLVVIAVPATYQARASVVLLPPRTIVGRGGNPYTGLGGLQPAADVVARAMTDSTIASRIRLAGSSGAYQVDPDPSTSGPVLLILATGSTPAGALSTMRQVIAEVPVTLKSLQTSSGVAQQYLITSTVVTRPQAATAVRKTELRALLVAVAGGVAITLFGTAFLDSWLVRRRQRQLMTPEDVSRDPVTASRGRAARSTWPN